MQIKGRVSSIGTQVFCSRHQGKIQRWVKWSYTDMPAGYKRLFVAEKELITISVRKTRVLRKVRLDTMTGKAQEVDAKTFVDRERQKMSRESFLMPPTNAVWSLKVD